MAADGGKELNNEIKSQFRTREGAYKLLSLSEYSRPNRVPLSAGQGSNPVRVSLVSAREAGGGGGGDRICFNVGRELYCYPHRGARQAADLSKPIDKRIYKGTQPTCHDFNQFTATPEAVSLVVGFSAGQVQYLDPIKKETSKLFNEERLIDKTKVTCLKWMPESESLFLAAHSSGNLYLYNVDHPCGTASPHYQPLKQGEGFSVYTCKSKAARNPLLKWAVGEGVLHQFAFAPDGKHVACVSQDGRLRVFHFDSMELYGVMKSYFGGLLCVCWSPDGKYVVTGGEDDLVTVWSFADCRVMARGYGHRSWISAVAFDPYTSSVEEGEAMEFSGSDEDFQEHISFGRHRTNSTLSRLSKHNSTEGRGGGVTYRFGSVGQDTHFCLWDLTEDVLYPHHPLSRARTNTNVVSNATVLPGGSLGNTGGVGGLGTDSSTPTPATGNSVPHSLSRSNSLPHSAVGNANNGKSHGTDSGGGGGGAHFGMAKFATLALHERRDKSGEREHKRNHSAGHVTGSKSNDRLNSLSNAKGRQEPVSTRPSSLGPGLCPRLEEVPLLEPLVCKKIAHERLTVLVFLEDCIVTACQEGFICTWARPGKAGLSSSQNQANSPSGTVV
ncbi:WD repeat-containing protein 20 [Callorhinchus milii]|uniref:DM1 locus, WD repeat containing n=1 Tax=Callorhinchus milii TaxID=7868 RepID=A0A4W3KF26_CALMI|nr:WD repeat-containing protein 20 [Callorhinchus milii]|eukprot:gi/632984160/ref/XP_007909002.1/ PREDICTED: dystrophia myotonica WD repeat-containing protein [Callorhinchus milii]